MIALKNVSAWGLISLTSGKIKELGEAVLTLVEAKLTVHQAMIILLCISNNLPISIGIMLALHIEQEKFVPVFKRQERKLDSFEELFNKTIELFTSDNPKYNPMIFRPYFEIKNHIAKSNNKSDFGIEKLFVKKLTKTKVYEFYKNVKKIMRIVYYNGEATYNKSMDAYIANNGNLIHVKNIYEKHMNKKYKKDDKMPDKIFIIGYVKLTLKEITIPVPHLVMIN